MWNIYEKKLKRKFELIYQRLLIYLKNEILTLII